LGPLSCNDSLGVNRIFKKGVDGRLPYTLIYKKKALTFLEKLKRGNSHNTHQLGEHNREKRMD
jgi:hypothetical protein